MCFGLWGWAKISDGVGVDARDPHLLCCILHILPRDVRTEQLFANEFGFSVLNH